MHDIYRNKRNYVVFVLDHGGNLESFVLLNFDEARSLLVHVKLSALAVAEAAYEFEHRDLHWFGYISVYNSVI
ncbi:hypothetical protein M0R45_011797 [Rubus argutus]|uniref:Uncharacterized protein n=1 Tax=Rubus argutus TaxID=59490 RepID=A0AAW1YBB6_RUBAR